VVVFYARDVASEQARSLFDVALGEILFFAERAKTVANNHPRIIPLLEIQSKQPAAKHTQIFD
jgi:hypothetical protein